MPAARRINFDINPEQEEELTWLREELGGTTTKDTLLRAMRVLSVLSREASHGGRLYVRTASGETERLLIPEIEPPAPGQTWLVRRAHPWRRQPWIKGRKVMASTVWRDLRANEMTPEEAAENWDLPLEAVQEALAWSEQNQALIAAEANEEQVRLAARGVTVAAAHR